MTRIAVIGGGRIGEALIAGLLEAGHAVRDLVVAEKSEPRAKEIAKDFGVLTASVADAAEGADVIVLAVVNFGAEVIADGNVHVYAPLRGKAIAGARGDTSARIFTTCMEAQLVAIAGIYRTSEVDLPAHLQGKAVQIHLDDKKLLMDALL